MQGASVVASEDGSDVSPPFRGPVEGGPAVAEARRTQADAAHGAIMEHFYGITFVSPTTDQAFQNENP